MIVTVAFGPEWAARPEPVYVGCERGISDSRGLCSLVGGSHLVKPGGFVLDLCQVPARRFRTMPTGEHMIGTRRIVGFALAAVATPLLTAGVADAGAATMAGSARATTSTSLSKARMKRLKANHNYHAVLVGSSGRHSLSFRRVTGPSGNGPCVERLRLIIDGSHVFTTHEACRTQIALARIFRHAKLVIVNLTGQDAYPVAVVAYRYNGSRLVRVGNLRALIASADGSGARFDHWTRYSRLMSAGSRTFTVRWSAADASVGMYDVTVTYKFGHGKVTRPHFAYRPHFVYSSDEYWTGNTGTVYQREMPLYSKAGGSRVVFYAYEGDRLTVTKVLPRGSTRYFKVRNSSGQYGWFADADYSAACDPEWQDCDGMPGPVFEEAVIGG